MKHKVFLISMLICFCFLTIESQQIKVASYNIRYYNPRDYKSGNGWDQRARYVSQLIQFHDFDIFGTQEGMKNQLDNMLNALPEYDYIGIGRDDGKEKGEYSAIFYKRAKFILLNSGNFWLSAITDRPNVGWDADQTRICSWGRFKLKKGNKVFWLFNLHFDHKGVIARNESAKLVLEKIKSMCGKDPVILMGDFNVDQFSDAYKLINTSGILTDVYDLAEIKYELNGTFNGFDPNLFTEKRIDHIFITNHFRVGRYGILTDTYRVQPLNDSVISSPNFPVEATFKKSQAKLPSDHFPVFITLDFDKKGCLKRK